MIIRQLDKFSRAISTQSNFKTHPMPQIIRIGINFFRTLFSLIINSKAKLTLIATKIYSNAPFTLYTFCNRAFLKAGTVMIRTNFLHNDSHIRKNSIDSTIIKSNIQPGNMIIFRVRVAKLKKHRPITMPILIKRPAARTGHIKHNTGIVRIIKMNMNVTKGDLTMIPVKAS